MSTPKLSSPTNWRTSWHSTGSSCCWPGSPPRCTGANPLVWRLAREAHQLREEAADDAVLATAVPDLDYARLLVGVARHAADGRLLGAHGVAPGRDQPAPARRPGARQKPAARAGRALVVGRAQRRHAGDDRPPWRR